MKCIVCGNDLGYEPEYCCNGHDCGCQGYPTHPPICSNKCNYEFDNYNEDEFEAAMKRLRGDAK